MSLMLEDLVTTEVTKKPSRIIIVGPPGIGKSSLIGNIPGVLVAGLRREDTWSLLKRSGAVPASLAVLKKPIDRWDEMLTLVQMLSSEGVEHNYRCLAIDSLTPLEHILFHHVCQTKYGGNREKFYEFYKGPLEAATQWSDFLVSLDQMSEARNMGIVITAHQHTKNEGNPEGDDFTKYTAFNDDRMWKRTIAWADAVLFARYKTIIKDGKVKGGSKRILMTGGAAACDAKNRMMLPHEIDMGEDGATAATNLMAAIKESLGG
jgi:hypothetical protein